MQAPSRIRAPPPMAICHDRQPRRSLWRLWRMTAVQITGYAGYFTNARTELPYVSTARSREQNAAGYAGYFNNHADRRDYGISRPTHQGRWLRRLQHAYGQGNTGYAGYFTNTDTCRELRLICIHIERRLCRILRRKSTSTRGRLQAARVAVVPVRLAVLLTSATTTSSIDST